MRLWVGHNQPGVGCGCPPGGKCKQLAHEQIPLRNLDKKISGPHKVITESGISPQVLQQIVDNFIGRHFTPRAWKVAFGVTG